MYSVVCVKLVLKGLYSVVCVKLVHKGLYSVICVKLVHKGLYSVVCVASGWTWMPGSTSLSLTAVMKRRLLWSGSSLPSAQMNTGQLEMSSSFFSVLSLSCNWVLGYPKFTRTGTRTGTHTYTHTHTHTPLDLLTQIHKCGAGKQSVIFCCCFFNVKFQFFNVHNT